MLLEPAPQCLLVFSRHFSFWVPGFADSVRICCLLSSRGGVGKKSPIYLIQSPEASLRSSDGKRTPVTVVSRRDIRIDLEQDPQLVGKGAHFIDLRFIPSCQRNVQLHPSTHLQHGLNVTHQLSEAPFDTRLPVVGGCAGAMQTQFNQKRIDFMLQAPGNPGSDGMPVRFDSDDESPVPGMGADCPKIPVDQWFAAAEVRWSTAILARSSISCRYWSRRSGRPRCFRSL